MQGFPEPDLARKLDKGKGKKACTVVMTASERKVRETESWVESGGKSLSIIFYPARSVLELFIRNVVSNVLPCGMLGGTIILRTTIREL